MEHKDIYDKILEEIFTDEDIDKLIDEIVGQSLQENDNVISAYGSIDIDSLGDIMKEFKKMPNYDELLRHHNQEKQKKQELIDYLKKQIDICDGYLDTIQSDLQEINFGGRMAGKTYLANEIMKNATAKKCYQDILSKMEGLK